jgi:hypothetical protein
MPRKAAGTAAHGAASARNPAPANTRAGTIRARRQTTPPAVRPTTDGQLHSLLLHEHAGLETKAQAARYLANVGFALRYGPHKTLPIGSMYSAVWRSIPSREPEAEAQRRATALTNALLADGTAIETTCIADRVGLAHASLLPALIALVRRGRTVPSARAKRGDRELELSDAARRVLDFVTSTPRTTAGMVRAHLGVPSGTWPNPADEALGELQRLLVIDRGPTDVPDKGAAYLTKDGIPYRLVDDVHAQHVKAAARLSVDTAAALVVEHFLDGARFATRKQLTKLFEACLSPAEVDAALAALGRKVEVVRDGRADLVIRR